MFKLGFVELFRVYFSVLVDMKSEVQALHKRTPLKESTHGTFLKDPIPLSARHFASGQNGQRAGKSQFAMEPPNSEGRWIVSPRGSPPLLTHRHGSGSCLPTDKG